MQNVLEFDRHIYTQYLLLTHLHPKVNITNTFTSKGGYRCYFQLRVNSLVPDYHTHTHTHMHTHMHTHDHMHSYAHSYTHTMHTRTHTPHPHALTHTLTHTCTQCTHTVQCLPDRGQGSPLETTSLRPSFVVSFSFTPFLHIHSHSHTLIHTFTHTHTHTHSYTQFLYHAPEDFSHHTQLAQHQVNFVLEHFQCSFLLMLMSMYGPSHYHGFYIYY